MSIRRMLVPVVGQDSDVPTLKTALMIADKLNAHVDALFVRADAAEFLPVMGEGYSGIVAQDILDAVDSAGDDMATKAKETVAQVAGGAGVPVVRHDEPGTGHHHGNCRLSSYGCE